GRGLGKENAPASEVKDAAIEKALIYVGHAIHKPAHPTRAGRGSVINAESHGDLYFLWSLERMSVVYDLKTVAGKDWYAWGSELLIKAQSPDGAWREAFANGSDTCFALLFLRRVNVVKDLTEQLKLLGKVKDPGHARPSVILPGETAKPEE